MKKRSIGDIDGLLLLQKLWNQNLNILIWTRTFLIKFSQNQIIVYELYSFIYT